MTSRNPPITRRLPGIGLGALGPRGMLPKRNAVSAGSALKSAT